MRIVCASDVHGKIAKVKLPPGDVLVLAGDVLGDFKGKKGPKAADVQLAPLACDLVGAKPLESTLPMFARFLDELPFKHVVLVAGTHDWAVQFRRGRAAAMLPGKVRYLQDSGTEIDGVRFWGSPWQPEFHGWAFNLPRGGRELAEAWSRIPEGLDVLVTHGPPAGILDRPWGTGAAVGDRLLLERVLEARPRFHVFGHVHGSYGVRTVGPTTFMNVSASDEENRIANDPGVIVLRPDGSSCTEGVPLRSAAEPGGVMETRRRLAHDHPNLGGAAWTAERVEALEAAASAHAEDCDECQALLESDPPGWCPVGESLHEEWANAEFEWSWQPDFPGRRA